MGVAVLGLAERGVDVGPVLAAVDPSRVSAGPLGLLVVLLMFVATYFLIRNMSKRLKRLPREFPAPPEPGKSPGPLPPGD